MFAIGPAVLRGSSAGQGTSTVPLSWESPCRRRPCPGLVRHFPFGATMASGHDSGVQWLQTSPEAFAEPEIPAAVHGLERICSRRALPGARRKPFRDLAADLFLFLQVTLRRVRPSSRRGALSATPSRLAAATRSVPLFTACSAARPVPSMASPTPMPTSRRASPGRRAPWYVTSPGCRITASLATNLFTFFFSFSFLNALALLTRDSTSSSTSRTPRSISPAPRWPSVA